MRTIFKREFSAFFRSPVAYVVIGMFIVITGLFFWLYNIRSGSPYFGSTLNSISLFLIFFAPIITMKLFAEEKKNGTEVLLRTAPVSMWGIVLGKFLAAYSVFAIMVGITVIFPVIMTFIITGTFPIAETIGAYIGFLLVGAVFVSIGLFTSSLTENQIVAAVSGIVLSLVTYLMSSLGSTIGGTVGSALMWLSPLAKFTDFASGLFNFASLIFYISFTLVMIFITTMNMERKRWN